MNIKSRKIIFFKYRSRGRWCFWPFIERGSRPDWFQFCIITFLCAIGLVLPLETIIPFTASSTGVRFTNSTPITNSTRIISECSVKINFCIFTFFLVPQSPSRPVDKAVCTWKILPCKYGFTVFVLKRKCARS